MKGYDGSVMENLARVTPPIRLNFGSSAEARRERRRIAERATATQRRLRAEFYARRARCGGVA